MTGSDIAQHRLQNQHISRATFEKPEDVVGWLGAVQAQDYGAAKWALGLRLRGATDDSVEQAFSAGSVLRTHVMRPTWHFVTPADIRWMLALTAPRVNAASAYYYRKYELDQKTFTRSNAALAKALQGRRQRTREELREVLERAGIAADGLRLAYIIMRAELDGIVCSGARRGKQFTYALLDERVPKATALKGDEALAELVKRYFLSHGPATLQDFVKWSGLTMGDARNGVEEVKTQFDRVLVDKHTYWFATLTPFRKVKSPTAYLLPNYDEYTIGYRNHSAVFDPSHLNQLVSSHLLVANGRIVGTWKRTLNKTSVVLQSNFFTPLTKAETRAIAVAAGPIRSVSESARSAGIGERESKVV